jgi:hypothetical protein
MQSLLSPHGVYSADDVDGALARVFGVGLRPLHLEAALFDAMLAGWRGQQAARYLKAKTIRANEGGVRRFAEHVGCWPWEWRASHVDEYFEDLLARPQRLARSTLRAYQWRLKAFSEYACDRRYPWSVICEREFGRGPGQLFDQRNLVAHLDEFEGRPASPAVDGGRARGVLRGRRGPDRELPGAGAQGAVAGLARRRAVQDEVRVGSAAGGGRVA